MSLRYDCRERSVRGRGISRAAQALAAGDLVVLPTDTVYGLACDAFSPDGVRALHRAKGRASGAAPPVFIPHPRTLDGLASRVTPEVRALAECFWPGGLTLVCHPQPTVDWGLGPTDTVLLRMPLHPVTLELLDTCGPLAVSGASVVGSPPATTVDEAQLYYADVVTVYLDGGPAPDTAPSTIVDGTAAPPRVLRLGALGLAELREVVPDLLGPDDPEPEPDPAPPAQGDGAA